MTTSAVARLDANLAAGKTWKPHVNCVITSIPLEGRLPGLDATRGQVVEGAATPAIGRFEGREAIRGFFRRASDIITFAIHYSLNGHIEVSGDTAKAQWYLFMPCTVGATNQAFWRAGIDKEHYVRVDGSWLFKHKISVPLMNTPFETGWAKTRFA